MTRPSQSLIVNMVGRWLCRLIQVFALYVIFHGHYSPGGGFQGGALLAASLLLLRMTEGGAASQDQFKETLGRPLGAMGAVIFAGVGILCWLGGGNYLDYGHLPLFGWHGAELRSMGILLIEMGVGLAVMATLISIFDELARGGNDA